MPGYVPIFDSIFQGSLCGRYPDTAAWMFLLTLADKNGVIDMTPHYISTVTGMPLEMLLECIGRFMQPDEHSRTKDHDGRRLVPLDPDRQWGWRIVNHGKYREKARKQAYDRQRTESGADAARKREARAAAKESPTCPDASRDVPLSNTNTNTNTSTPPVSPPSGGKTTKRAARLPDDFELTAKRRAVAEAEGVPAERTFAKFCDHWRAAGGQNARKRDWDAAWRNWCRREADRGGGRTRSTDDYGDQLRRGVNAHP